MMLITFLSLFSFSKHSLPKVRIPNADKAVHFAFYFVAAILCYFFITEISKKVRPVAKQLIGVFLLMLLYGIVIEVIQMKYTLNRHGDIIDVLANSLGALCGVLVVKYVFSKKSSLK